LFSVKTAQTCILVRDWLVCETSQWGFINNPNKNNDQETQGAQKAQEEKHSSAAQKAAEEKLYTVYARCNNLLLLIRLFANKLTKHTWKTLKGETNN